jgi:hypothetical protein
LIGDHQQEIDETGARQRDVDCQINVVGAQRHWILIRIDVVNGADKVVLVVGIKGDRSHIDRLTETVWRRRVDNHLLDNRRPIDGESRHIESNHLTALAHLERDGRIRRAERVVCHVVDEKPARSELIGDVDLTRELGRASVRRHRTARPIAKAQRVVLADRLGLAAGGVVEPEQVVGRRRVRRENQRVGERCGDVSSET